MADVLDYRQRAFEPDQRGVAEQGREREHVERVADVDRDRHAVADVERGLAAALVRMVLTIVVDQEGVVKHLQRGSGVEPVVERSAACLARREEQRRAQALPLAQRIIEHRTVQRAVIAPLVRDQLADAGEDDVAILVERVEEEMGGGFGARVGFLVADGGH